MNPVISPKSGASRDTVTVSPNAIAKNRNALAEFVRFVNKVIFLSDEETQIGMLRPGQVARPPARAGSRSAEYPRRMVWRPQLARGWSPSPSLPHTSHQEPSA